MYFFLKKGSILRRVDVWILTGVSYSVAVHLLHYIGLCLQFQLFYCVFHNFDGNCQGHYIEVKLIYQKLSNWSKCFGTPQSTLLISTAPLEIFAVKCHQIWLKFNKKNSHSPLRFVQDLMDLYEFYITAVFLWCLLTICSSLLVIQLEIVECHITRNFQSKFRHSLWFYFKFRIKDTEIHLKWFARLFWIFGRSVHWRYFAISAKLCRVVSMRLIMLCSKVNGTYFQIGFNVYYFWLLVALNNPSLFVALEIFFLQMIRLSK